MRKKKKKNGGGTSSTNSGLLDIGVSGGMVRLKVQHDFDPTVLEMAVIIVGVLSGPFPLLKKEEALQTCYDSFSGKIEMEELPELGRRLVNLGGSDCDTIQ